MATAYPPPKGFQDDAHVKSVQEYKELYTKSIEDPSGFWGDIMKQFVWKSQPTGDFVSYNFNVNNGSIFIKWLEGAKTNICYNALDRIVNQENNGDKIAFYWEGNDPNDFDKITYRELLQQVCKFSNVLKSKGVKKGDTVSIYMPMILELPVAMLACARIGAIHSIVFGGFSAESLQQRILATGCKVLITTDGTWRGAKLINLKSIASDALQRCKSNGYVVSLCIVVKHIGAGATGEPDMIGKRPSSVEIPWDPEVDVWWNDLMKDASDQCEPEWVDSEDPLFMLYTSGSTGKPKGVLHSVGGYMMYAATTFKYVFDYKPDDVYWCTADIGWITGHTYVTYGPLLNGATSVIFEGLPTFPDNDRYWAVIDKYQITKFYTAPTAIRSLMKFSEELVISHSLKSLKVLGTVGEPINPEAWQWYHKLVGHSSCPIVDTYWQTETGGHILTPLPGAIPTKPGSATFPFFGVVPALLTEEGQEVKGPGEGYLVFKQPWPGMMRTVFGDHKRFEETYFKQFPGFYTTGDGARRDADGYYWITGRIDDMLNISGHLLSTAEVESAMVEHKSVAEAAAIAIPHSVKGQCLYVFVTTKDGCTFGPALINELKLKVRELIGPFAVPDYIQSAPGLPKTRSGKIMRRILRKIAVNDDDYGDTSTLMDESIVGVLLALRPSDVVVNSL